MTHIFLYVRKTRAKKKKKKKNDDVHERPAFFSPRVVGDDDDERSNWWKKKHAHYSSRAQIIMLYLYERVGEKARKVMMTREDETRGGFA